VQPVSQLDLLNLARSCEQSITSDFGQVITITFAMVVGVYYFLHQAGIRMKIFTFAIYTCGMLFYLGMMLGESEVASGASNALRALPEAARTQPTLYYLAIHESWVGTTSSVLLNLVFWVLWIGAGYLLFFWRKPHEIRPQQS
jgi:hypothetical protein